MNDTEKKFVYKVLLEYSLSKRGLSNFNFNLDNRKLAKYNKLAHLQGTDNWVFDSVEYVPEGTFCTLGHPIRYKFNVVNTDTGDILSFGRTCVTDFFIVSNELQSSLSVVVDNFKRLLKEYEDLLENLDNLGISAKVYNNTIPKLNIDTLNSIVNDKDTTKLDKTSDLDSKFAIYLNKYGAYPFDNCFDYMKSFIDFEIALPRFYFEIMHTATLLTLSVCNLSLNNSFSVGTRYGISYDALALSFSQVEPYNIGYPFALAILNSLGYYSINTLSYGKPTEYKDYFGNKLVKARYNALLDILKGKLGFDKLINPLLPDLKSEYKSINSALSEIKRTTMIFYFSSVLMDFLLDASTFNRVTEIGGHISVVMFKSGYGANSDKTKQGLNELNKDTNGKVFNANEIFKLSLRHDFKHNVLDL